MKDDIKKRLEEVFAKHDAAKRAAAEAQEKMESKEAGILRQFLKDRDEKIRPAMEEIGRYVQAKGYRYEITTTDDGVTGDRTRRPQNPSIKLKFLFADEHAGNEGPHLSVICQKEKGTVLFHENTIAAGIGGHAGGAGEVNLDDLTTEIIQDKILAILKQVF